MKRCQKVFKRLLLGLSSIILLFILSAIVYAQNNIEGTDQDVSSLSEEAGAIISSDDTISTNQSGNISNSDLPESNEIVQRKADITKMDSEKADKKDIPTTLSEERFNNVVDLITTWAHSETSLLSATTSPHLALGDAIPTYRYDNGHLVPFNDVIYYPVFSNGKGVAVVSISAPYTDKETIYIGEDWIKKYNNFLETGIESLCVVLAEEKTFLKSKDSALLVFESSLMPASAENSNTKSTETKDLSNSDIIAADDASVKYLTDGYQYSLDITPSSTKGYRDSWTFDVGTIAQRHGYCWAICVKLSAEYYLDNVSRWTPEEICDAMGIGYDQGGYDEDIMDAFITCYNYDNAVYKEKAIGRSNVISWIDDNDPAIVNWTGSGKSHSTVLCGYNDNGYDAKTPFKIRISDSNYGSYRWLSTSTSQPTITSSIVYTAGVYTMNWRSTILV